MIEDASHAPPVASEDAARARLADYFARLGVAFTEAARRSPGADLRRDLAGRSVRIAIAGHELAAALMPALAHLPPTDDGSAPHLEILAWDEAASGVPLPSPPWCIPKFSGVRRIMLPEGFGDYRIRAFDDEDVFLMYCVEAKQGILWTRDARRLPNHHRAAPFFAFWHWWAPGAGLRVLHAGCVGADTGAALLVGAGGSGKSTTSLLCAQAGLRFLSDDFCLVRFEREPAAVCLFSSGKLHRDHLLRFPELAMRAVDPVPDHTQKPVIFLREHFPGCVIRSLPLRAVISPVVTGRPGTRVVSLSPAGTLRALAPSTLILMPHEGAEAFHDMAALVRALPCFRLELGTRLEEIAPAVRMVLDALD